MQHEMQHEIKKYREIGTYTMRVTGLEPARRGH